MRNRFPLALGASVLAVAGLTIALRVGNDSAAVDASNEPLVLFCAAGVKPPVEATLKQYEQECGTTVRLQFGGSGTLLANIATVPKGDLYLAGDASYVEIAHQRGLVAERLALAVMRPVIAVARGNPHRIESLESLLGEHLKIGLGNPDGPAVGKMSKKILQRARLWEAVEAAVSARGVFKPTVPDLANDLKLGTIDVAILFDATVRQYPELEAIPIPNDADFAQEITVGVLTGSRQPTRALHFARYLGARDRGLVHFEALGYTPADGDQWADRPELTLLIGGVLRPAVEETIGQFEHREGVRINTTYNGCGILVAQLKAGERADAYFACDDSFMTQVSDMFFDPLNVSQTHMVIAVPKGNPRAIRSLEDLETEGLKLGVANAKQSALGALTEQLLKRTGHYEAVMENVVSQVPTADLLIAQMKARSLDAAIVYEVNAIRVPEAVELLPIGESAAAAVQPVAVAESSRYKHLTTRLVDALRSTESRKRFVNSGFTWLDGGQGESPEPGAGTGLSGRAHRSEPAPHRTSSNSP